MLQRVYTRVSKPAARYSDRGSMAEHCSACRFFMSGGDCARVLGRVLPQGWCKYFSREAVQRWNPLWPMEGIPAPPGATLDLSFLTSGALDPRITFTRASTATYFNYAGVMQTAAANAPRWDYNPSTLALNGLLIEEARTNVLLNSATLGTQSVTVTAQAYTLSFYGTGTITESGTASGALVGTGANQRVSQTFTPTAGTLTLTVTGSVLNAQLEAGSFPTSYIPTTAAAVTRAVDVCTIPTTGWYSNAASSLMGEFIPGVVPNPVGSVRELYSLSDGTSSNRMVLRGLNQTASNGIFYSSVSGATATSANLPAITANAVAKMAATWGGTTVSGTANGGAIISYSQGIPAGINVLTLGNNLTGQNGVLNGWLRRVRYWPRVLSNTELQSVTT